MKRGFIAIFLLVGGLALGGGPTLKAQSQDSLYRASVAELERLSSQLEEVELTLNRLRESYRSQPDERENLTPSILEQESLMLSLRGQMGGLERQISSIEEARSLEALTELREESVPSEVKDAPLENDYSTAPRRRNLIDNACFKGELPAEDYALLRKAQEQERQAAALVELYAENYARLINMQEHYLVTVEQREADSLYDRMGALLIENREVDDSLAEVWSGIFDQKSYSYSYMLEKGGKEILLEEQIAALSEAAAEAEAEAGNYASDALVAYFTEKRALVRSEQALAREYNLKTALDSLGREMEYLASVEYRLPRIELSRRYLLDYSSISFADKLNYTANNIPSCEIYDHGTIFRIRLGSYKYRQQPSIFRRVEPLYLLQEGGRYVYYTGGFATKSEARLACELLRDKGFRQPIIVCWEDGVKREVAEDEPEVRYRVEIAGAATLSEEARGAVKAHAGGKELARVGSTFVVGPFDDEPTAEQLALALRQADGGLEVRVVKVE